MPTYVHKQVMDRDMAIIAAQAPLVKYNTTTSTWPTRPSTSNRVIWSGGPSAPAAATDGDIWLP